MEGSGRLPTAPGICTALILGLLAGCGEKTTCEDVWLEAADGARLAASYYPPKDATSPCIILLHMLDGRRGDWDSFAADLVEAGFAVFSFDLRGHGGSRRQGRRKLEWQRFTTDDFMSTVGDVQAAVGWLLSAEHVDPDRIGLVGASIGANLGAHAAAGESLIKALVLLSPGKVYKGVDVASALDSYGRRPALIIASEADKYAGESAIHASTVGPGERKLKIYSRGGHGTEMLEVPEIRASAIAWLKEKLD